MNEICSIFQEFNTLKEDFNDKFYAEENENANAYNNGYNNKALEIGCTTSEEYQQLKVCDTKFKFNFDLPTSFYWISIYFKFLA